VRQVAEIVLESSEASDGFAPKLERWYGVGDALLGVGTIFMMVSRSCVSVIRFGSSRASR
jgi:hypothetical protein